jgi:hypothetical protein
LVKLVVFLLNINAYFGSMKKLILSFTFLLFIIGANAQTQSAQLEYNNTRIGVLNGGDFFWDLNSSQYQVPKTSGGGVSKSTIFSGSIWLGAQEEDGTVHLSAMTYRQRGQDFWPGPHSNDTTATRTKYDKIFKVSAAEIAAHKANSSSPIPSVLNWPGNGDTAKGEPYQLAPFVDVNKNGKYEPKLGDYPSIKGTGAVYCVYSDQGLHTQSGGRALGVDVHQMFYQDVASGFEEINLASFKVVNRSDTVYDNFKFGIYVDFDLGNFVDDFVGCDSLINMIYAYNGDDDDEGVLGYGLNPPSQNMMFLNTEMGAAVSFNNDANPIKGNPSTPIEFYNYLDAKWLNGYDIEHGGDGIAGTHGVKTSFMFPGDPSSRSGWNENTAGNSPADRRMLAVAKETSLAKGEVKCYDIAFVYGRGSSGGALGGFNIMKTNAVKVQAAYDANTYGWKSGYCGIGAQKETAGVFREPNVVKFTVYPNPSTGLYTIKGLKVSSPSFISNVTGQIVKQVDTDASSFDLTDLEIGIYFLKTEVGTVRLIKM